jgi:hypothetical protein
VEAGGARLGFLSSAFAGASGFAARLPDTGRERVPAQSENHKTNNNFNEDT